MPLEYRFTINGKAVINQTCIKCEIWWEKNLKENPPSKDKNDASNQK
jgi:hypothetical protein